MKPEYSFAHALFSRQKATSIKIIGAAYTPFAQVFHHHAYTAPTAWQLVDFLSWSFADRGKRASWSAQLNLQKPSLKAFPEREGQYFVIGRFRGGMSLLVEGSYAIGHVRADSAHVTVQTRPPLPSV